MVSLTFDQLVVNLDERRPDPLFGDAQSPVQKRHERQKEFDGHAAHGLGEKHGSAEQDVQHQGQSGPGDGQDEQKNDAPKDPGRNRVILIPGLLATSKALMVLNFISNPL